MTSEQKTACESLVPTAKRLARKMSPNDDEGEGVALLALCKAVIKYPAGCPLSLKTYCYRGCKWALIKYLVRKAKYVTNLDLGLLLDRKREITLPALPEGLAELARLRWVYRFTLAEINQKTGLPIPVIRAVLLAARRRIRKDEAA